MNNIEKKLKSNFKDILILYIKYKRSQGYKYDASSLTRVIDFDKELFENKIINIDDNFIKKYCVKREGEKEITTYYRQCCCKDICLFIKNNGYPDTSLFNKKFIKFSPSHDQYIYTENDIYKIFNYLNTTRYNCRYDKYFSDNMRMLILLFYSTGIRRSEGFNLKFTDINHEEKSIIIKQSKNNITRVIPLSDSVYKKLNNHINTFSKINMDYIFLKENGKQYDAHFQQVFKKILIKLNIKTHDNKTPRIHDFRFTFAVTALNNMAIQGIDIYCTLPILQIYMGHTNIRSTEYYLKYTEQSRKNITENLNVLNEALYGGDFYE